MSEPQITHSQDPAEGADPDVEPHADQPRVHPQQPAEGPDDESENPNA